MSERALLCGNMGQRYETGHDTHGILMSVL